MEQTSARFRRLLYRLHSFSAKSAILSPILPHLSYHPLVGTVFSAALPLLQSLPAAATDPYPDSIYCVPGLKIGIGLVAGIVVGANAATGFGVRRRIHLDIGSIHHGAGFHCCSALVCETWMVCWRGRMRWENIKRTPRVSRVNSKVLQRGKHASNCYYCEKTNKRKSIRINYR